MRELVKDIALTTCRCWGLAPTKQLWKLVNKVPDGMGAEQTIDALVRAFEEYEKTYRPRRKIDGPPKVGA